MKYKFLFLAIFAVALFGCTDDFEEINTNPNEPTAVPNAYLLSSAQKSFMDFTVDEWWNGRRGNQLAQYWASNQYSNESRYQLRTGITNTYWTLFYAGSNNVSGNAGGGMINLQQIIDNNEETPVPNSQNQIAVATILKTWMFQMVTDCWGQVPYSQALKGINNPAPAYDSQEAIYDAMMAEMQNALNLIDLSKSGPDGDIIFNGDMSKWKKFGASLLMRVGLRIADVKPDPAKNAVKTAFSAGVMESNSDNALFAYMSGAPNNHPINEDRKTRNDFAASHTMVNVLKDLNDPRLSIYYEPAANSGEFVGEVYGLSEADAAVTPDADISQRGQKVLAATFPGIYMDYAQVEFMLAEAVERGFIDGNAEAHYNNGIRASMDFWTDGEIDPNTVDNYIAQPDVNYASLIATTPWRDVIGKQKWIALYMQGIEGWTEWRRLDFGILPLPAAGPLDGDCIPTRMKYPLDEYGRNENAVKAAVAAQGPDEQCTKIWWDVQ